MRAEFLWQNSHDLKLFRHFLQSIWKELDKDVDEDDDKEEDDVDIELHDDREDLLSQLVIDCVSMSFEQDTFVVTDFSMLLLFEASEIVSVDISSNCGCWSMSLLL